MERISPLSLSSVGANRQAIMQYWWLTGDASYNDLVTEAMLFLTLFK
jgi:hypothetical protein